MFGSSRGNCFRWVLLATCWASLPALATEPTKKVLILGDSLTEGFGLTSEQAFPALVQRELHRQGLKLIEIINAGVSGSTSASGPSRLKWHLKIKPQVLVLALGANDGLRGIRPEVIRKNLVGTIRLARENQMKVLLAGMKMPPNYGEKYTAQFGKVFAEVADAERVPLIPFLLEGVGGNPKMNLPDGIHPNAAGHEVVAATVIKYLAPLL